MPLWHADEDVQAAAKARQRPGTDTRARVLGVDDLLDLLVQRAAQAAEDAEAQGVGRVGGQKWGSEQLGKPWPRLLSVQDLKSVDTYTQPAHLPLPMRHLPLRQSECAVILQASRGERLVVGLTGYPNVGKSSTINALFGSKKTAVAPTPGKTKHFQVFEPRLTSGGGSHGQSHWMDEQQAAYVTIALWHATSLFCCADTQRHRQFVPVRLPRACAAPVCT